jgi:hypothetical protein
VPPCSSKTTMNSVLKTFEPVGEEDERIAS